MTTSMAGTRKRVWMAAAGTLMAGAALLAVAPSAPAATPAPHWGFYQWSGGSEKVSTRAFWLFDRTGDDRMHAILKVVTDAWNSARDDHPTLPYIAVYKDDANAGKCFVNRTPGYSVASACMFPENMEGVKGLAGRNADAQGHMTGAAMAVAEGLTTQEMFSVACHTFGHVMGLENSTNPASCMYTSFEPDKFKWYDDDTDGAAILALYDHDENAPATTSTTAGQTTSTIAGQTTSTIAGQTTSTIAGQTTSTTEGQTTSTTEGQTTSTTSGGATTTTAPTVTSTTSLLPTVTTTSLPVGTSLP